VKRLTVLFAICASCASLTVLGQGRLNLYPDDNLVWHDMVAHLDAGLVRMGNSWRGEVIYTVNRDNMWNEVRVFRGFSTSTLDVAFTVRDNQLYLGDSSFSDAILYTFSEGQIFVGDSTFPLDVAYTLREEPPRFARSGDVPLWGLYRENSRSWSDRIGVLEGPLDAGDVFAVLSAAGLL
jgi:hypothetical protein